MNNLNKSHYSIAHDAIKALLPVIGDDDGYTHGYTDGIEAALAEVEKLIAKREAARG